MLEIAFLIVILAVILLIFAGLSSKKRGKPDPALYQPAKHLFSPAERSFLGVLDQAVGDEHRVFGKVRVADVASVRPGLSNAARRGALNRVSGKHFDFIVCRADDLSVVCAVELNDKSHKSQRAQTRDAFLVEVCRAIDLPLLAVPAKQAYSLQELREQFGLAITSPMEQRVVA